MTYWRSIFLVLLGACSYGVLSIFMKHAFQLGFTPFEMSGSQLIFGGLIMTLMALFFSKQRFSFKYMLLLAPASLMMASTSLFYHQAVSRVSASLAIVLLFQFTWIGVLLEAIVDRKWPTAEKWVSLVMLGAGTVLASGLGESGIQSVDMVGLIFGLMSGATFALVIFFSGRILPGMDPYLRSAISIGIAALMLSIIYPPTFLINGQLLQGLLPLGLLVAIFGSVIPIFCLAVGVPRIGNGLATILSAVELPTVVLLSSFVLQETVSLPQWGGVFMILAAICVPQVKWRKLFSPSHALEQERM
ncbi:DMT family transporter [Brevibacillus sp. AG]|uniref:EamA family transporter n=1 Tax=Brevibacillus sp. AG TaxID=3020891 RepID=UPI00085291CF|nr:DMT family transporter [Brevibacillus sp. AG]MDC0760240.1 DMT family transporter [Brevibacillus sp. AG]